MVMECVVGTMTCQYGLEYFINAPGLGSNLIFNITTDIFNPNRFRPDADSLILSIVSSQHLILLRTALISYTVRFFSVGLMRVSFLLRAFNDALNIVSQSWVRYLGFFQDPELAPKETAAGPHVVSQEPWAKFPAIEPIKGYNVLILLHIGRPHSSTLFQTSLIRGMFIEDLNKSVFSGYAMLVIKVLDMPLGGDGHYYFSISFVSSRPTEADVPFSVKSIDGSLNAGLVDKRVVILWITIIGGSANGGSVLAQPFKMNEYKTVCLVNSRT
ncbi:uncharacterized protein BDR25DRAFT_355755 [Lindgomyces ingoldianus]|uniref:Uncharacterized protein n=1 Tax=Lindgomyces ingoldianus TaxID=673940 RepID=A0ACB6QSN2_9PLEO|nr:uncharacterized protein BDR25DRAFT_355755 [Lindgomyces ingoldianus]KAF2470029.1 hypothetical protein BDR25DRAFT_355755 [Lindgomyces ingoldianus]